MNITILNILVGFFYAIVVVFQWDRIRKQKKEILRLKNTLNSSLISPIQQLVDEQKMHIQRSDNSSYAEECFTAIIKQRDYQITKLEMQVELYQIEIKGLQDRLMQVDRLPDGTKIWSRGSQEASK